MTTHAQVPGSIGAFLGPSRDRTGGPLRRIEARCCGERPPQLTAGSPNARWRVSPQRPSLTGECLERSTSFKGSSELKSVTVGGHPGTAPVKVIKVGARAVRDKDPSSVNAAGNPSQMGGAASGGGSPHG